MPYFQNGTMELNLFSGIHLICKNQTDLQGQNHSFMQVCT